MLEKARSAALALVTLAVSCGGENEPQAESPPARADGPLLVATVNYPLAYLAERIGGEAVEVVLPVAPDVDPAFWQPGPADIARYVEADLILLNGAGYAGWTRTAALPSSRVVDTSEAFAGRLIERADRITHSHGPEGEHAHGGTAFTTWLDPELALLHAAAVRDALTAQRPASADAFQSRFASLEADLRALDRRLAAAVARDPERAVIFSHPVYEYLSRRYDLHGPSLDWEPDATPTAEQWSDLEQIATLHGADWLIWEGDPLPSTVQGLNELDVRSVVFDPCGNRPEGGDLLTVLAAGAEALERVFGSRD